MNAFDEHSSLTLKGGDNQTVLSMLWNLPTIGHNISLKISNVKLTSMTFAI